MPRPRSPLGGSLRRPSSQCSTPGDRWLEHLAAFGVVRKRFPPCWRSVILETVGVERDRRGPFRRHARLGSRGASVAMCRGRVVRGCASAAVARRRQMAREVRVRSAGLAPGCFVTDAPSVRSPHAMRAARSRRSSSLSSTAPMGRLPIVGTGTRSQSRSSSSRSSSASRRATMSASPWSAWPRRQRWQAARPSSLQGQRAISERATSRIP